PAPGNSAPAYSGGVIITTGPGDVRALNLSTGALIWHAAPSGLRLSSATIANGVVYVLVNNGQAPSNSNGLYAYSVTCSSGGGTCTPLWVGTISQNTSDYVQDPPPVVGGGVVYTRYVDWTYAFAVGCGSGGASCNPVWNSAT